MACLRGESIIRFQVDGRKLVAQDRFLLKQYARIRALAVGPDGYIYFSTSQNDPPEGTPRPGYDMILRLRPVPAGKESQTFGALVTTATTAPTNDAIALTNSTENLYQQLCASCHGQNLQGTDRGKNLLDHKYGSTRNDISQVIKKGVPDKGMPAWEGVIKPADIDKMADFILAKTKAQPASVR